MDFYTTPSIPFETRVTGGGDTEEYSDFLSICVRSPNTPSAQNRALTTEEDQSGSVTLIATDPNNDTLTFALVSPPNTSHGSVTISGNTATFTPKPNWNGTTSFTYKANDGKADSNTATVTVTVNPVNDPPSVSSATLNIDEDTVGTLTLEVSDVDLQFEGDSHTWSIVTPLAVAHGTATIAGNKLTFTPAKDWNGTTTLHYRATDSKGAQSNTAVITITARPVNDPPVASDRLLTIAEDTPGSVTLVATDVDGDTLTYSIVTKPNSAHGSIALSGNKITFNPSRDWNGTTIFTYKASDGALDSNIATVTINVTPVNDSPVAKPGLSIRTIENLPVKINGAITTTP
jgi:hypothetical protein